MKEQYDAKNILNVLSTLVHIYNSPFTYGWRLSALPVASICCNTIQTENKSKWLADLDDFQVALGQTFFLKATHPKTNSNLKTFSSIKYLEF